MSTATNEQIYSRCLRHLRVEAAHRLNQAEWAISKVVCRLLFFPFWRSLPGRPRGGHPARCFLVCCLLVSSVALLAAVPATAGDHTGEYGERVGGLIGLLGRLHPIAVHFPIALIIVAGFAELCFARTEKPAFGFTARFMLLVASAFAVAAVLLGFAAASGKTFSPDVRNAFTAHRVLGIVTAGLVVLTAGLAHSAANRGEAWRYGLYRVVLVITLVAVVIAAHTGATLTFGPGYLAVF